jgi:SAM-dependent methyltransferase
MNPGTSSQEVIQTRKRHEYLHYLQGQGIEIGAGSDPFPLPARVKVQYADCITPDDLLKIYPGYYGIRFVTVDIVAPAHQLPCSDNSLDFIINAHVIEHLTDPLGAVAEWGRVLKPKGILYSVIPDKTYTYDQRRPCTPLEHLILDYEQPDEQRDREHIQEYIRLVEKTTVPSQIEARAAQLLSSRDPMIHYHVWDYSLTKQLFRYAAARFGFEPLLVTSDKCFETIVVMQKI